MFEGFTATTCDFFATLERHNDRVWWAAHRRPYDEVIRPTLAALVESVQGCGSWRIYRPHNDTRFRASTEPYKTFIGAVAERPDGIGVFVQLRADGLRVGTGIPMPAPDQLQRWRAAVADDDVGPGFVAAVAAVEGAGARVFAGRWPVLRRVPTGLPADHPRADLLRWKGVEVDHRAGRPPWLDTPTAACQIGSLVSVGEPMHRWLASAVGASALTPEQRFAPRRARSAQAARRPMG